MTMSREEALAELSALRSRRQAYAAGVANPSPDRQHALHDAALLEAVLAALSAPVSFEKGSPLPDAVQALALAGRKLDAIRVLRNEFGIGLLLAKDAVEAFVATERLKADARLLAPPPAAPAPTCVGEIVDGGMRLCRVCGPGHVERCQRAATPAPVAAPPADLVAVVRRVQVAFQAEQNARALWSDDGSEESESAYYAAMDARLSAWRDLLAFPLPEVPDGK